MTGLKKTLFLPLALAVAAIALPSIANAQLRNQNKYTKGNVSTIIKNLENSSDTFSRDFSKELNRSNINGTRLEGEYNGYVRNYENSLDSLRRNFDRSDRWWETRNDVQDAVNKAQPVNEMIVKLPFSRALDRQWNQMRNDLNKLADTYDMPGIGGGGWNGGYNPGNGGYPGNGGGWNGSGGTSKPPTWSQGTFYGRGPNGEQITLTIDANGRATSNINGSDNYGTYYRGNLNFNGSTARVSQNGNGIRTVSVTNGETINYNRNGWGNGNGNGNGGGWGGGNGGGRPSNWAVGNFRATNPIDGSVIYMSVQNNGSVTVTVGNGTPSYGSLNGSVLRMGPYTSNLYKQGNGFRTVSTTDGQTITYVRN